MNLDLNNPIFKKPQFQKHLKLQYDIVPWNKRGKYKPKPASPPIPLRTHTIGQFVAEFFANPKVDYSIFREAHCRKVYVGRVVEIGDLLENIVLAAQKQKVDIEDWYGTLELCTDWLAGQYNMLNKFPDEKAITYEFSKIIRRNHTPDIPW